MIHPRRIIWTLPSAIRERLERLHRQAKATVPSEEDFGLALLDLGLTAFERQLEQEEAKGRLVQLAKPNVVLPGAAR